MSIRQIYSQHSVCIAACFCFAFGLFATPAQAKTKIEAVKGKKYEITKRHGPWMVMVASLKDVPEDQRKELENGLSAQEAADELVYELRKRGIPAYTYETNDVIDHIEMTDRRTGGIRRRAFKAQQGHVVVMAGNYNISDLDDQQSANDTLKYIKNLKPKVLVDTQFGGVFKSTPGRPGPLSGAFLTVNPLLSPEEIQRSKNDPLVLRLNSGMKHSLLRNPGKYTLQIATFTGKSMMHSNRKSDISKFDNKLGKLLDQAGNDAWRLCEAMRNAKSLGYDTDYETWVFHDRNKSIVTIGSYDSQDDPRLKAAYKFFAAKMQMDSRGRNTSLQPSIFTVPQKPKPGKSVEAMWPMDPNPKLIEVPQVHSRR
jgi:hypothetical protein